MASVIATATITFGSDSYKVKKVPGGQPVTCEAIDVTCADDGKKKFVPGVLKINDEIAVTVAAETPPAENSVAALTITLGSDSVSAGQAIVKSVTPADVEAGGNREITWDVVFQPAGAAPSSSPQS